MPSYDAGAVALRGQLRHDLLAVLDGAGLGAVTDEVLLGLGAVVVDLHLPRRTDQARPGSGGRARARSGRTDGREPRRATVARRARPAENAERHRRRSECRSGKRAVVPGVRRGRRSGRGDGHGVLGPVVEHADDVGEVRDPAAGTGSSVLESSASIGSASEIGWPGRVDPASPDPAAEVLTCEARATQRPLFPDRRALSWITLATVVVRLSLGHGHAAFFGTTGALGGDAIRTKTADERPIRPLFRGFRPARGPGANTASSIGSVSRPVKVFCWLTW